MAKPIIGIISNRNEGELNRPFTRVTSFSSMVAEKIHSMDAIPFGVIFPYGIYNEEILKYCDGFVFQGGSKIELCQILAMDYVIKHNMPVLGICNGMQTMAGLEYLSQYVDLNDPNYLYKIAQLYDTIGEEGFLEKVIDHNYKDKFYIQNLGYYKHKVYFNEDSSFYDYYNSYIIDVPSLHNCACRESVFENSNIFKVSGKALDGTIEAIEAINEGQLALGVQYHIELDDFGNPIFKDLIEEAGFIRKYKK